MNEAVKPCIKCGAQDRNKYGACEPCQREGRRKYYEANREKAAERMRKWREANREKAAEQKREYYKANREANREKELERGRKYYETNREKESERKRKARDANPNKFVERSRKYYEANREKVADKNRKWFEANKDRATEYDRKWREKNAEKIKIKNHNRRAKVKGNGGKLSPNIVQTLMALQKGKCACCGKSLSKGHHLDHIIPIALGGMNDDSNVQLLTPKCNLSKGAKHPVDYMRSKGKLI